MKAKTGASLRPAEPRHDGQVVCATDFSAQAAQAANVAAVIAKRLDMPVLLVHVLDYAQFGAESTVVLTQIRGSAPKKLDREAARLRKLGAEVRVQLLEGRPEAELVRVARRPESRLLVMGSLGHVAISNLLVGSVAERTAGSAPIPTLVIRDEKPLVEWAEGKRSLNVFLAADFTTSAEVPMRWVRELRRVGSCNLVVGYVARLSEAQDRLGLRVRGPYPQDPQEVQRALERDMRTKVSELVSDTSARLRVEVGKEAPESALIEMAHEERADLFLVGTHQRHGLGRLFHPSVSRAVLQHAPMSVACVPTSARVGGVYIPQYHRVLVSTDFSELGNHALPSAYSVLSHGGGVRLVHVVPPFEGPRRLFGHYKGKRLTKRSYAKLLADLRAKLQALVPEEATALGVETEFAVLQGRDIATTICQEAERFGADLICIGTHGRSGLVAAAIGSVAQKVISHSRRPVLVVRSPPP